MKLSDKTVSFIDKIFFEELSTKNKRFRVLELLLVIVIFSFGVRQWSNFFNKGNISFTSLDWRLNHLYYSVIHDSVQENTIPYHITKLRYNEWNTDRFFSIPETNISPQVLLLKSMNLGRFIHFNALLMYLIGFIGLFLLKRKYSLTIIPFSILFLLFNFNGHIVSHLGAGHLSWFGYFFVPLFFYYLTDLVEQKNIQLACLKLALISFFMILQGSFHIFVWSLLFLTLVGLFNAKYLKHVALVLILAFLLSLFRIVPALMSLPEMERVIEMGYPTITILLDSLIRIKDCTYNLMSPAVFTFHWWEYNNYIDILGLFILLYFGIYVRITNSDRGFKEMDIPMTIFFLASLSYFYSAVAGIKLPFVGFERVPSRFLVIPVIALTIISTVKMQEHIHIFKTNVLTRFLALIGVAYLQYTLVAVHLKLWGVEKMETLWPLGPGYIANIISKTDPAYFLGLQISTLVSLITFVIISLLIIKSTIRRENN